MRPYRSILAACDFSIDGNRAVRRAALLARAHGARLRIVHVLRPAARQTVRDWFVPAIDAASRAAQAREALRRVAAAVAVCGEPEPIIEVIVGEPVEVLTRASPHADLVVLGRRGRFRLGALLLGGTTSRLLATCPAPVLVVGAAADEPYRCVLVSVNAKASADAALLAAARLSRGGALHVFHAIDRPRKPGPLDARQPAQELRAARARELSGASADLRRAVARLGLDSRRMSPPGRPKGEYRRAQPEAAPVTFAAAHGPAVPATLRHAAKLGADLIVTGSKGRARLGEHLLGHVGKGPPGGHAFDLLVVPRPRADRAAPARAAVVPTAAWLHGVTPASNRRSVRA